MHAKGASYGFWIILLCYNASGNAIIFDEETSGDEETSDDEDSASKSLGNDAEAINEQFYYSK